ncbi:hypothetical protein CY34DRAFT_88768 [Suillus luteus UH-Slu-Lm8-n1]|uniref:WD40 repeat-like protein n=1 Tax=Suillus luteus UH-Slu-Lm8-n1 TaxID=930992 RepID=A0A0D0B7A5_9AGAM|nr:hypothetical protein CY34DRAFT_88768 [Suillus luteus UH-Slu-Lm8-n1]
MRGHIDGVQGVLHLPREQQIITCSRDGSLRLWDLKSGSQIGEDWKDEGGKKVVVNNITLSPSGKIIVIGSDDRKMRFWNVKMGKVVAEWMGHTSYVVAVCWSASGKHIMSGSWDGMVRVWNVKTGERILKFKTGHEELWAVSYSPDNTQIATGGYIGGTRIWDAKTGELITTLKHSRIVFSLAWTSDGKKLITGLYGLIRIYDTATWEQNATLRGHEDWINAISLSPTDDRLLASASHDRTARLWNLDTNLPVGPPLQHKDRVQCAAFSANGQVLVTGGRDKNAYVWDVNAILTGTNIVSANTLSH